MAPNRGGSPHVSLRDFGTTAFRGTVLLEDKDVEGTELRRPEQFQS
jgi:hypothetical protein